MFNKILIANRGEIACRVIRTARSLGVTSVAVYSDADRRALHVEMADEAIHIGGSLPTESYLNGDRIIEAARASGADAIHPGYGFLSENPDFVGSVEAAGLVFIGPSAEAIRAMGLKDAAKQLMEKAGVPVVPGYHGPDPDPGHLEVEAATIGYPIMIKAVAGGGGKGMRLVTRKDQFFDALESARAEAIAAFGNDAVLIEKFVEKPRHIEVQIFGDGHNVVHLFERDCSLQRRHQKVIEEAPAPGMTDEMRHAMCKAAVRAAGAVGYSGAGTVEFIVDARDGLRPDRFWFMEMNTRLQVEHPVTEAVTGIDLVEWQLRVAAGEPLPKSQDQLKLNGHSFEARLYAEDAENGFLPATGTLTHLNFPMDARIDTGVRAGDDISTFYDPMIAKMITHGPTRAIALSRFENAISSTEIAGTITNRTFLARLARNDNFRAGKVHTDLIASDLVTLTTTIPPDWKVKALAALCAAGILDGANPTTGFSLWAPLRRTIKLIHAGQIFEQILEVSTASDVTVELAAERIRLQKVGAFWTVAGHRIDGKAVKHDAVVTVFAGDNYQFEIPDELAVNGADGSGENTVLSPMPGLLKAVLTTSGAVVKKGDKLAILEAMKMEHTLTAPRDGTIAEVLIGQGAQVEAGAVLIRMEEAE